VGVVVGMGVDATRGVEGDAIRASMLHLVPDTRREYRVVFKQD
jgi:hypothetical protein